MELEYCGMFNWTVDCPLNSKNIFLNMLESLKIYDNIKILEIGTYTGTSIVSMLMYLPMSSGTVIDNWNLSEDELEGCRHVAGKHFTMEHVHETFIENTKNLTDRLTVIENDSSVAMVELINAKQTFDFIYVDASHTSLDCAMDLALAWVLLKPNGLLGIDDYLYYKPGASQEDLPKIAVDNFLKKFEGRYIILSSGYRLFLKKI